MKRVATLILAALPMAALAQTPAPAAAPVVEEKTTTVAVVAEKKSPITFTPYGFVLLNAFNSDTPFASKLYPAQALPCPGAGCNIGGSYNMSAQQSRFGANIAFDDTAGWTGAKLAARFELDFGGGYSATANSTTFYNALVRLRLAYMTASWGGFSILAGQDYALLAPLFATSVAWQATPIFWQACNMWNRSPQIKVAFDSAPKNGLAFGIALAALNPSDATAVDTTAAPNTTSPGAAMDFSAGNRSRMPVFEGRIYAGLRTDGVKTVELGFAGHTNTRRYVSQGNGATFDVNENALALDLDVNFWIINVRAEAWRGNAIDDFYAGIVQPPLVIRTTGAGGATVINSVTTVPTSGGWAQLVLKPFPFLQLLVGYGVEVAQTSDMAGPPAFAGTTRYRNSQFHYGLIFPAGKNWRFSLEGCNTVSNYYNGQDADGAMYALSSQLSF
jgi:hypothetical protein